MQFSNNFISICISIKRQPRASNLKLFQESFSCFGFVVCLFVNFFFISFVFVFVSSCLFVSSFFGRVGVGGAGGGWGGGGGGGGCLIHFVSASTERRRT